MYGPRQLWHTSRLWPRDQPPAAFKSHISLLPARFNLIYLSYDLAILYYHLQRSINAVRICFISD
jgi:hypothetical protein